MQTVPVLEVPSSSIVCFVSHFAAVEEYTSSLCTSYFLTVNLSRNELPVFKRLSFTLYSKERTYGFQRFGSIQLPSSGSDDKWSTHAFKRGMVTVNDTTGQEVLYMNSVNKMKRESKVMINNELCL